MPTLTPEQKAIIHHPRGQHARVLAVAGSGKTTTMVHRIKYLVTEQGQDARRILVVMFNRLAREDFERKIAQEIPDDGRRPKVYTFHSLAYKLRQDAAKYRPTVGQMELWAGDTEELALICMHRAIGALLKEGAIMEEIDAREALNAVGLWKASLIPPERAGHRTNPDLPLVYRRFEEYRLRKPALTFDDFIPMAMDLFECDAVFRQNWTNKMDYIIVDEYQDINYGQEEFVRVLAGTRADVMVVGDDDQTIYEWRAARPHYILRGFKEDFANKPTIDYKLSRSFRFGPLVAQTAYNAINFNQHRESKPLVSHDLHRVTGVDVLTDKSEQATQISVGMAQEVVSLVRKKQVPPGRIAVLGRIFAQLEGLQTVFIQQKIPFRVMGMGPFFERDENRTLIDYIRLSLVWNRPARDLPPGRAVRTAPGVDEEEVYSRRRISYHKDSPYGEATRTVLAVANTPSRKLPRITLQQAVERGGRGQTLGQSLEDLLDPTTTPLRAEQCETLQVLIDFLYRIAERVTTEPGLKAGDILTWIAEQTSYHNHFCHYYGEGEASQERLASVDNFINFATLTGYTVLEFIEYLRTLDPTQGKPMDKVITMTTVHRTKGLEYDYVFIPACTEGNMPVHLAETAAIYDTTNQVPNHPPSPAIESERRLFYVAVTRAVKHLYIGTIITPPEGLQKQSSSPLPSRFLEEMQLAPARTLFEDLQRSLMSGQTAVVPLQPNGTTSLLARLPGAMTMLRYVVQNYPLPTAWADEINRLLATTPEQPFAYSYKYPALDKQFKPKEGQPEPPPWSDPWEDVGITE